MPRVIAPAAMPASSRLLLLAAVAVLAATVLGNAWVAEDAYITFRSIEQLWAGHGPRWNPHERVQAFTHPLWYLVLAAGRGVSRDLYIVALAGSFAATAAVAWLAIRLSRNALVGAAALVALASSRAVIDYSTSGLENALAAALMAASVGVVTRRDSSAPGVATHVLPLATLAGLLACTRHDLMLLVAPSLAVAAWRSSRDVGWRAVAGRLLLGCSPILVWTAFSVVYYGFPFPNTAYAKLQTGLTATELARQGREYVIDLVVRDPAGAVLLVAGTASALARRHTFWLGVGLLTYVAYAVGIGGDFMSGRFFMVPIVASVILLAAAATRARLTLGAALGLATLSLLQPTAPIRVALTGVVPAEPWRSGIADEKAFYFPFTSARAWWRRDRTRPFPDHASTATGVALASSADRVTVAINIGFAGYVAPLNLPIIDVLALSDPLLARRPAGRPSRVGHYWRLPPEGYVESVRTGTNRLTDARLRPYYDDLRLVTDGPLFTRARWRAIVRLNATPPPWTDRDVPRLEDVPPEWLSRPELMAEPRQPPPRGSSGRVPAGRPPRGA
jgi:arabinofuranosyltransferase